MFADRLKCGDTIGLISPSHVANEDEYKVIIAHLKRLGFKVKVGANIYKDTYGYLASEY